MSESSGSEKPCLVCKSCSHGTCALADRKVNRRADDTQTFWW